MLLKIYKLQKLNVQLHAFAFMVLLWKGFPHLFHESFIFRKPKKPTTLTDFSSGWHLMFHGIKSELHLKQILSSIGHWQNLTASWMYA